MNGEFRGLSTEQLIKRVRAMGFERRRWLAYNNNTDAEILIILAEDEDEWIRLTVARNYNTPEAVKQFINQEGYAGLTLAEFMAGVYENRFPGC